MIYSKPITDIISRRFSCRAYKDAPIEPDIQRKIGDYLQEIHAGPLGTTLRFHLVAGTEQDRKALRGLGTYGFFKDPSGFVIGAMCPGQKNLEDYGYRLEQIVLFITDLGLGTCWLGGIFARSNFAKKISLTQEESIPAIIPTGIIIDEERERRSLSRKQAGADSRLAWESLFFDRAFGAALSREKAGSYAIPLDMLRLGPSASNKQPWRVVQEGQVFHFYVQRTKGYPGGLATRLLHVEDLQRVDLGIAMCHFELTARELGLNGKWTNQQPGIEKPDMSTEYIISWIPAE